MVCQCWSRLSRNHHNRSIQQKVHRATKVAHGQVHAARISAIRRVKRPMGDISPRIQWRTIKRRIQVRTTGTWLLDSQLTLFNIESHSRFNDLFIDNIWVFIIKHSLNPIETLDDICLRSQWGKPQYQLIQSTSDGKTPAFLYRITILPLGVSIQSPKVSFIYFTFN